MALHWYKVTADAPAPIGSLIVERSWINNPGYKKQVYALYSRDYRDKLIKDRAERIKSELQNGQTA